MKVSLILSLILFVIGIDSFCQKTDNNTITWQEERMLKWSDFKGIPDTNSGLTAVSKVGISCYEWELKKNWVAIRVEAVFVKDSSWARIDSTEEPIILAHEQLHFDIAELYARKLRKELSTARYRLKTHNQSIAKLFKSNFSDFLKSSARYDQETNFAMDSIVQNQWMQEIRIQLDELSRFSKPIVKCRLHK